MWSCTLAGVNYLPKVLLSTLPELVESSDFFAQGFEHNVVVLFQYKDAFQCNINSCTRSTGFISDCCESLW